MPRYYFHIRDGDTLILDDDGCELADVEATKAEAFDSARDLRRQDATDHFFTSKGPTSQCAMREETWCWPSRSIRETVRDEHARPIYFFVPHPRARSRRNHW
jgi:hypothetical protein